MYCSWWYWRWWHVHFLHHAQFLAVAYHSSLLSQISAMVWCLYYIIAVGSDWIRWELRIWEYVSDMARLISRFYSWIHSLLTVMWVWYSLFLVEHGYPSCHLFPSSCMAWLSHGFSASECDDRINRISLLIGRNQVVKESSNPYSPSLIQGVPVRE